MIKSFGNKIARDVYDGSNSKHARKLPRELHPKAMRLLDQINTAPSSEFLSIPPGNRLEKLVGDMSGWWSLRINSQWRIVFRWLDNDAYDVKIADYH
ncbi:MAG: plasmid maintenance system killer protein [Desulfobacteraceae bacterium IS3]|jgi:proteic killer suppression protein|nr:MAG: plasmid maintenance system killer protein [Desulfobacteraceae bacterium IS3]HAO22373.1 plasmid maintenance system killer protein [Desulfobacteraceae bacterium]